MIQRSKLIRFHSAASILLFAASFATSSFAATIFQDSSNQSQTKPRKHPHTTSTKRQAASTKESKTVQRTIIFVGGKKSSQGATTKSNPTQAKKSNGTLNPQPIPPGKQRQPE